MQVNHRRSFHCKSKQTWEPLFTPMTTLVQSNPYLAIKYHKRTIQDHSIAIKGRSMSVDLHCIHTRSQKVFLKKFYTLLAVQNYFDFLFHFPDSRGTEKRVEVVKLGQSLRLNCHPSTNGTPKKWKPHSKWKKSNFRYTKWYKNGQRLMPSGLSKNMSIKNKRLV